MSTHQIFIRSEQPADYGEIRQITLDAFAPMPFSDGTEHDLIGQLRDAGVLSASLVAVLGEDVVGHVAFSPAMCATGQWYALGPVAVRPDLQRSGIGKRLIGEGLAHLESLGADGCVLVGSPAYYARFGFIVSPDHAPSDVPPEYFMVKPMREEFPDGSVGFHPLFSTH